MRLATMASAAVLAVSSAALAQVASSPVEQKPALGNVADGPKSEGTDNGALANTAGNATDAGTNSTPAPRPSRRR